MTTTTTDPLTRLCDLGLTDRQSQVFLYLFEQTAVRGYQPSIRELARHFGITSRCAMVSHFQGLVDKGWIDVNRGRTTARAVRFLRCPDGTPFTGFRWR